MSSPNQHRESKPRRWISNKWIVVIKIFAACLLFVCCCYYFFRYLQDIWADITSLNPLRWLFVLIFIGGFVFVFVYIAHLVSHIEDKDLYRADRFDILYRIIFASTVLAISLRNFLTDLSVPTVIIIIAIVSGVITIITPRIVDNNNQEF